LQYISRSWEIADRQAHLTGSWSKQLDCRGLLFDSLLTVRMERKKELRPVY